MSAAGTYTVTVSDAKGCTTQCSATLAVNQSPNITGLPQNATVSAGSSAGFGVTASGMAPLSYQWRKDGVNLADGGQFSGATTSNLTIANVQVANAGNYAVVVGNSCGAVTSAPPAVLTVTCPAITLTPSTLPASAVGAAYSQGLTASGGTGPYSFTNTAGSLPAGLSISGGGVLSGTPSTSGTNSFTVQATDANGCAGSQAYTLIVGVVPAFTSQPVSQTNTVGSTAVFNVTATGSQPLSYQWRFDGTNLTSGGPPQRRRHEPVDDQQCPVVRRRQLFGVGFERLWRDQQCRGSADSDRAAPG